MQDRSKPEYVDGLVTVLVASYNCEKTLRKIILSVVNQTYKDIEIIISDDCSVDRSYEIALDLQNEFPNLISVFKTPQNLGPADNFNFLLSNL